MVSALVKAAFAVAVIFSSLNVTQGSARSAPRALTMSGSFTNLSQCQSSETHLGSTAVHVQLSTRFIYTQSGGIIVVMPPSSHLVFNPDYWEGEDYERYQPGGYHPIIIGDILSSPSGASAYRIFMKLGHGSFSTVWLAENVNSTPQNVAVKVSTADGLSSNEADHLQSMSSPYIAPVINSFSLEGPNGKHHVLVTEVMLPLFDFLSEPRNLETRKTIIWQLAKAVEHLHAKGLVHGDLHIHNTGVTFPDQFQSLGFTNILLRTEDPVLIPIFYDDITRRPESLPAYVTCRSDLKNLYQHLTEGSEFEPQARLYDFGSVRREGDDSTPLMCMKLARAPEIIHAVEVSKADNLVLQPASDIWALGTMIYKIMTGFEILSGYDLDSFNERVPVNDDEWWQDRSSRLRRRWPNDVDFDGLITLLKKIFVLEPSQRPSAAAIINDDWFSDIRAKDIRTRDTVVPALSPAPDLGPH